MSEQKQKLSDAMTEFVGRLEADGIAEVSLDLVKQRWIPEIAAFEAELETMDRENKILRSLMAFPDEEIDELVATAQQQEEHDPGS